MRITVPLLRRFKILLFLGGILLLWGALLGLDEKNNLKQTSHTLAVREISLSDRQADIWVNNVFKDNILLNLAYLRGTITKKEEVNWEALQKPFVYNFTLAPHTTFAFHEDTLPQYAGKIVKTTNAHFNTGEGFKSDGYLVGDGVCHLASLLYWAAVDAKLEAVAPTNHDFAHIPQIPKEYGVAIYNAPFSQNTNALQNLYITNTTSHPIVFQISYSDEKLKVTISRV